MKKHNHLCKCGHPRSRHTFIAIDSYCADCVLEWADRDTASYRATMYHTYKPDNLTLIQQAYDRRRNNK